MQSGKIAIIDMGTNTFHLLIVRVLGKDFEILQREKVLVRIGQNGISKGLISTDAQDRALAALQSFKVKIGSHKVQEVFANATSAMRNASNGQELADKIESETGIPVRIISGNEEAEYIYYGVKTALDIGPEPAFIMDIGGGSVEFIIGNQEESLWKTSLEIGAQRLLDLFQKNDPISQLELKELHKYLDQHMQHVKAAVEKYNPKTFIGCSGTFDTLSDIYIQKSESDKAGGSTTELPLPISGFLEIHNELLFKNRKERMAIPGMVESRVDMIVVASALINYLLEQYSFDKIRVSSYALKEGVLHRIVNQLN